MAKMHTKLLKNDNGGQSGQDGRSGQGGQSGQQERKNLSLIICLFFLIGEDGFLLGAFCANGHDVPNGCKKRGCRDGYMKNTALQNGCRNGCDGEEREEANSEIEGFILDKIQKSIFYQAFSEKILKKRAYKKSDPSFLKNRQWSR